MNITGFKAALTTGGVRPNSFLVKLQFPGFVTNGTSASLLGAFMCKGASLPASTVAPIPVFYNGRAINVAGEREFQPWTVTVYNENFLIRDAFERWSNGFNNISNNSGLTPPLLYQTDLAVFQTDRNSIPLKTVEIIDAFPIEISPIELDWEANNQIEVFQVTFAYNYYKSSGVND